MSDPLVAKPVVVLGLRTCFRRVGGADGELAALWEVIEPLLPAVESAATGRPRVPDRVAFNAVFVLVTGIAWRHLPRELGCSGVTAWRRLRDWQQAGVWKRAHESLLERLNAAGAIDWAASVADGSHIRALEEGLDRAVSVDRGRTGSKHHLICDTAGIPLAITLTSSNRNDVTQLLPLVDGVGPVRGKPGRPRQRAEQLIADRGYDHDKYRRELRKRGVKPVVARRNTEHGSGLGKLRRVVERTFAWLHFFRRLRIRWERRPELHEAFMHLGCAVICQRYLRATWPDAASLEGG